MAAKTDPVTVFIDADNTLWDTDGVFAAAQVRLLGDVTDLLAASIPEDGALAFVRAVDQAIAERHQDGLRYPPVLLVRGLEKALAGFAPDAAARAALRGRHQYRIAQDAAEKMAAGFHAALTATPALRKGVRDGLEALSRSGARLLIVSEACKARVETTAMTHGILVFFERIFEGRKNASLYVRMLALTSAGGPTFMVGDQMNRDIEPASAAGLETIYFPGGFQPRWRLKHGHVIPDHVICDFSEVAKIVERGRVSAAAGCQI